jgi:hypothetical protein
MTWSFGRKDAIGLALALTLMAATIIYSRHGQPSVASVAGRFTSDCCGELVISPSSLTYRGEQTPLRFSHEKFGLTAYPERKIGPFFARSGKRQEPPVIYFDGPDTFTIVSYKGDPAHFTRAS